MHNVYSRKGLINIITLFFGAFFSIILSGQSQNKPFFDYAKKHHFGFFLGTNLGTFKYDLSPYYYNQDTIKNITIDRFPGLSIGGVWDIHLGEYFDFRIIPTLSVTQRTFNFYRNDGLHITRVVESSLAELPILFKMKSYRHNNVRFYVIAGIKYAYDLSSDKGIVEDPSDPKLKLEPSNWNYEYGAGLDLYFKYFKLSPEIKFSGGINNVLIRDGKIYSEVFQRFRSNFVYISFFIEG